MVSVLWYTSLFVARRIEHIEMSVLCVKRKIHLKEKENVLRRNNVIVRENQQNGSVVLIGYHIEMLVK